MTRTNRRQFLASSAQIAALAAATGLSGCVSSVPVRDFKLDGFSGDVISLGDQRYEKWRRSMPWQLHKPNRYPAVILRPRTEQDIQLAIRFAAQNQFQLAVKSGGHHVWGAFLRDGGVLLDLANFREVAVTENGATARVQPAVWSSTLMQHLMQSRRAFPVAHCATVPMGGYLLGGGFGINGDTWGPMACSNVVGATVFTSDGQRLEIDESNDPELFWSLRGAGPGFSGVVTEYDLKLFDLPQTLRTSVFGFPIHLASEVVAWSKSIAEGGAPGMELLVLLAHNPFAPENASAAQSKLCIARFAAFASTEAEAAALLSPISDHALVRESLFKMENSPATWDQLFVESVDITSGFGYGHYAVDNLWTDQPEGAVGDLAQAFTAAPSKRTHVVIQPKSTIKLHQDMAFSTIRRAYMAWYNVWDDSRDTQENLAWSREASSIMSGHAQGHYINEIDVGKGGERKILASFAPGVPERLAKVARHYDPSGLFQPFYGGA